MNALIKSFFEEKWRYSVILATPERSIIVSMPTARYPSRRNKSAAVARMRCRAECVESVMVLSFPQPLDKIKTGLYTSQERQTCLYNTPERSFWQGCRPGSEKLTKRSCIPS